MSNGVVSVPCTSAASTAAAYGVTLCPIPAAKISIPVLSRLCSCAYKRLVYTTAPFRLPPFAAAITALWLSTYVRQLITAARRANLQVFAYASDVKLDLTANKAGEQYTDAALGDIAIMPAGNDVYMLYFILSPQA